MVGTKTVGQKSVVCSAYDVSLVVLTSYSLSYISPCYLHPTNDLPMKEEEHGIIFSSLHQVLIKS